MRPERSTATAPVRSHPAGQGQLLGGTRGRAAPPAPQSPPLPACARDAGLAPGPTRVKSSRVCIAGGGRAARPFPTRRGSALPRAAMHTTCGNEGGKGQEKEYIPSRTVNHAE